MLWRPLNLLVKGKTWLDFYFRDEATKNGLKEEISSGIENSEGYGNIIQERQDQSKTQGAKWPWGQKEALKCKNDLGDVVVLIRYESTGSLLA